MKLINSKTSNKPNYLWHLSKNVKEHFFVIFAGMFWDISKIFLGGKNILKVLFYCFLYLGTDLGKAKLQRVVSENTKIRVWYLRNNTWLLNQGDNKTFKNKQRR